MIDTQGKTTTLYAYQNGIGANTEATLNRTLRHILYGDLYDGGGNGGGNGGGGFIINCEGATDTILISLFGTIRVSGDGWSFQTSVLSGDFDVPPDDLSDGLFARNFITQGTGDAYRIINVNPTHQRLKFESLVGSNSIEVLPQPNTAWSFNELPVSSAQELNVCLGPAQVQIEL